MITREEEEDLSSSTKQESENVNNNNNTNHMVSSSSRLPSPSSCSRSNDLRIVRVSKAFGGKDRHSKVCTVKGLRDRRVRLSVATAIQLYDLQERLGLNQPSKVVDWLLNAAKDEIDELPPLQIPPPGLNFPPNLHYSMLMAANNNDEENLRGKSKEIIKDEKSRNEEEMENVDLERQLHHQNGGYASLQKPSNIQGLMNHNSLAYSNTSSFLRWDPSNLSLSHSHHHQPEDNEQFHNFPSGSQVVLYPPYGVCHPHQSYFDLSSNSIISQHHLESSTHHNHQQEAAGPPIRPFHFSVMATLDGGNKQHQQR